MKKFDGWKTVKTREKGITKKGKETSRREERKEINEKRRCVDSCEKERKGE